MGRKEITTLSHLKSRHFTGSITKIRDKLELPAYEMGRYKSWTAFSMEPGPVFALCTLVKNLTEPFLTRGCAIDRSEALTSLRLWIHRV